MSMEERNVFINKKEIDELFEKEKYRNCMEKKYFEYIVSTGKIEYIDKYLSYSKKKEEIKDYIDRKKVLMVIDKLFIKTENKKNIGELEGSGIYNIEVSKEIIEKYGNKFISDGVFCLIKLEENIDAKYPYYIEEIDVLEDIGVNLDEYRNCFSERVKKYRVEKQIVIQGLEVTSQEFDSISEIDLVLNTIGISTKELTFWEKILFLVRLIPLCEANYNLMELGGNGIGKTKTYSMFSPECEIVQEMTATGLIYNIQTKTFGSLATKDVIVFDEVNKIKLDGDKEKIIPQLLNFMADGQTTAPRKVISKTSLVFSGNVTGIQERIEKNEKNIFDNPHKFEDNAFLDRIHFFLPAWGLRRYSRNVHRLNTSKDVFRFDYFSKALSLLRNEDYSVILDERGYDFKNGSEREVLAIRKTVSGLIKLTYPDKLIDNVTLDAYIAIAIKGRGLVNKFLNNKNKNNVKKLSIEVVRKIPNTVGQEENVLIQFNESLKHVIYVNNLYEINTYFSMYKNMVHTGFALTYNAFVARHNYNPNMYFVYKQNLENTMFYYGKFYPNRQIMMFNNINNIGEIIFLKFALDKVGILKNIREAEILKKTYSSSKVNLLNEGRVLVFGDYGVFPLLNWRYNYDVNVKFLHSKEELNYDSLFGDNSLDENEYTTINVNTRNIEADLSSVYQIDESKKLKIENGEYVEATFMYKQILNKYYYTYIDSKGISNNSEMMTYVEFKYFLSDNGFIKLEE